MDSLTTLDYPATGFSLLYEYGLFKQKIIDGNQVELPDIWMPGAEGWFVARTDKTFTVRFGGKISESWEGGRLKITHTDYDEVQAVPYDMMIPELCREQSAPLEGAGYHEFQHEALYTRAVYAGGRAEYERGDAHEGALSL